MCRVEFVESLHFGGFASEQLHDADAGKPLLQECVHLRETCPDIAIGGPDSRLKNPRREEDERDHGKRRQREMPVDAQHDDADRQQRAEVTQTRDDPRREQFV